MQLADSRAEHFGRIGGPPADRIEHNEADRYSANTGLAKSRIRCA